MTLIGKCFLANDKDHQHYRTGEIVLHVAPSHYLIQFDAVNDVGVASPMEIVDVSEMSAVCSDCGMRLWNFFDTHKGLQDFLDWLDKPADKERKGKIVSIKDGSKSKH